MNEPTRISAKRRNTDGVIAGPLGFCGRVSDLWVGPLRSTIELAAQDAAQARAYIDQDPTGVMV